MKEQKARDLIENLLDRLKQTGNRFELPGGVLSAREVQALGILVGLHSGPPAPDTGTVISAPAVSTQPCPPLALDCLDAKPDRGVLMCVDFGTAYSKAAIWKEGDDAPIPIDLGASAGVPGLMVDSAVYISDDHLFFGPGALQKYRLDNDPKRAMFLSPKEHLTHAHDEFDSDRPDADIDPKRLFKTRELLSLYLAYLTALSNEQVFALGIAGPILRRFAAPGWGNAQISQTTPHFAAVAGHLRRLLIDAQILSDTLPMETWRSGLDLGLARCALDDLARVLDEKRATARFVEQPVLEAVAAAAGVQDRLVNQRPQVVVVDVGAGTTDLGVFKYSIGEEGARVAAYKNGMRAMQVAGNRLDDALIDMAWAKQGLASDSSVRLMFERRLRIDIRENKRDFIRDGSIRIETEGFTPVVLELEEFEQHKMVASFAKKFAEQVTIALNSAGIGSKNFVQTNQPNIAVFTGGGGRLPFLRRIFGEPLKLETGSATFEVQDPEPAWLDAYTADVRAVFPQIAVSTGGCAPNLPDEKASIMDSSVAPRRFNKPMYR